MRDFLLIITVIAFMIFGFFIIVKVDKFFAENYRGFEHDEGDEDKEQDAEYCVKKDENENNLLR